MTYTWITIIVVAVFGVVAFFSIQAISGAVNSNLANQLEYQTCVNALMGDDNIKPEDVLTRCKEKQDTQAQ